VSLDHRQARTGPSAAAPASPVAEQMVGLFQSVHAGSARDRACLVVFLAAHEGCGTSRVVREFARVAAGALGRRVLLLDANAIAVQPAAFGLTVSTGWEEATAAGAPLASAAVAVPDVERLSVAVLSLRAGSSALLDSDEFDAALAAVRNGYDLIVVDAPSPVESVDALLLSRVADGCVLVVEAERTRWQVAENLQARVVKYGGRVVGAVLNKRRYHIPRLIYDRL